MLVAGLRGDHNRLGFSVQVATRRYPGMFLADPLDGVPTEAIDFLVGQLRIADPSCVKQYTLRPQTHREHAAKIRKAWGLTDFAQVEGELEGETFLGEATYHRGRSVGLCCSAGVEGDVPPRISIATLDLARR